MPIAELLRRISSRELAEWQAYFLLEHEEIERHRAASTASAAVRTAGRGARRRR